jgi:Asp-tRNA(Asn)/Glu-tRNA(Gln) amidotransferase A subunit family amidase
MIEDRDTRPIAGVALAAEERDLLDTLDLLEEHFEREEPPIRAFVPEEGRFARLRREADELFTRFPSSADRPPFFGVPIGIKDIFHVDGLPTRAGSELPVEELAGDEAVCVTALKRAGALVLGKTVTTEFAYFAPGPTRNPRHLEHTPGGSSSGSAAAVAAGLCPLALGTQTIGSISRPASYCGIVGFKPSYDRISRHGVIPLSPSLDHVGVLAADVELATRVAGLLCSDWQGDEESRRSSAAGHRPVLGVPEGPYLEHASAKGLEHFRRTCKLLADAGYTVRSVMTLADFPVIQERHLTIMAAEAAQVHAEWYPRFWELYDTRTRDLIERGTGILSTQLEEAFAGRQRLQSELADVAAANEIDLWISPAATGPAPEGLESTGDPIMNLPWTQAGLPTVCLPAGDTLSGMPMGLQVAAGWYGDEELLEWAGEMEEVLELDD